MLAEGETTSLYSDELLKSRSALFARRYRPWAFLGAGWLLFLTFGTGIELWSNILLGTLVLGTLATPVLHFLTSTKFQAELAALTPCIVYNSFFLVNFVPDHTRELLK